uniref:c-Myc-binding protein n=1 Tax=Anopheles culicifacies TaxID=139723 RepID=A0A182MNR1_9DIPT
MSNYKPIDLSKEDFRKYLDRQGVLDAITKVLVKCNSERPENALAFVVENLNETHGTVKTQLLEAHQEIERLKKELSVLKVEDKTAKPSPSTASAPGVVKQDAEIDTPSANNDASGGGGVELKTEAESSSSSVGEATACATATAKQEQDAVVASSPSAEPTSDTKPKENAASSGSNDVQEPAAAAVSASPNDAPDAKEPSTSENK